MLNNTLHLPCLGQNRDPPITGGYRGIAGARRFSLLGAPRVFGWVCSALTGPMDRLHVFVRLHGVVQRVGTRVTAGPMVRIAPLLAQPLVGILLFVIVKFGAYTRKIVSAGREVGLVESCLALALQE
jgi:hypothetical protein